MKTDMCILRAAGPIALLLSGVMSAGQLHAAAPSRIAELRAALADPQGRVMVDAHRACWRHTSEDGGDAPENSLAGIEACRRLGVDIIEIDVRRTADGQLVLMHDATVDRTTSGTGRVSEMTAAQVHRLRLRRGMGGADAGLTGEHVPTLEEAGRAARGQLLINLDMKDPVFDDTARLLSKAGVVDHAIAGTGVPLPASGAAGLPGLVAATGQYKPILSQRQQPDVAGSLAVLAPYKPQAVELVFGEDAWFADAAKQVAAHGSRAFVSTMTPGLAAGHTDIAAIEDPGSQWGRLLAAGASIIQTDEPGVLIQFLAERRRDPAGVADITEPETVTVTGRADSGRHKIILAGDSTVQQLSGWGGEMCAHRIVPGVACINLSHGGRSTRSVREEGSWDKVLAEAAVPGYQSVHVLIQFGHNDQNRGNAGWTERAQEFPDNLRRFVSEVRALGATPVLVTPLVRRYFDSEGRLNNVLKAWADQVRLVAKAMNVPVVDLNERSKDLANRMGPASSRVLEPTPPGSRESHTPGDDEDDEAAPRNRIGPRYRLVRQHRDITHLGEIGAPVIADLVINDLVVEVPEMRAFIRPARIPAL